MNIGILGGTFNPPHNGHVAAAQYAQKQLDLHRLFLIPNNQPPHKQLPHPTASTRPAAGDDADHGTGGAALRPGIGD